MMKANKAMALCLLFSFAAGTAYAGGGLSGGATELTQQLNNSELVAQVRTAGEQLIKLREQLDDMINNTLTIPDQIFRDVRGVYSSAKGVIGKTQGIAYNLANLDEEVKRRFKSYADLGGIPGFSDLSGEYRGIADTQRETVRSTMEAIGVSMEELEGDASALEELQKKAGTAKGRNELIQAANQLLAFLAADAMKLRYLQMMQAQAANTAYLEETAGNDAVQRQQEVIFKPVEEEKSDMPAGSMADRFMNNG